MTHTNPTMPGAKPWYQSRTIWAVLISLLSKVLVLTGLSGELSPDEQNSTVDAIILIVGGLADVYAIYGRKVAKTKIGGDAIPPKHVAPMIAFLLLAPVAMPLAGCQTLEQVTGSTAIAGSTLKDEKALYAAEAAFHGANLAAEAAVDSGALKGTNAGTVRRALAGAKTALDAARTAYRVGNATEFTVRVNEALNLVATAQAVVKPH